MRYFAKIFFGVCLAFVGICVGEENQKLNEEIDKFIKDQKLEVVDYDYASKHLGDGTRDGAKALFIDTRANKKYLKETIPSSIQIEDDKFDEHFNRIANTAKDREIIIFCKTFECQGSVNVAVKLKQKGFANVKIYKGGISQWRDKNYIEIGAIIAKNVIEENSALLIDARPHAKFLTESIIGAISIPDTKMDELSGRFPIDKNASIITFCQGYECKKSHALAQKLISLGYKNVANFSGGMNAWKEAGFKTTKSDATNKNALTALSKPFLGPIKKGLDEGTIDPQWFLENYKNLPKDVVIIDVRKKSEHEKGAVPNSQNISFEENSAKDFLEKLPKDGYIIFHCLAGSRSLEAWQAAKKAGFTNALYLDAGVKCDKNECKFTPNETLDPTDW